MARLGDRMKTAALALLLLTALVVPAAPASAAEKVHVRPWLQHAASQHPRLHADTRRGHCLRRVAHHRWVSLSCRHTVRVAVARWRSRQEVAPVLTFPAPNLPGTLMADPPPNAGVVPLDTATLDSSTLAGTVSNDMTIEYPAAPNGRLVIYVHGSSEHGGAFKNADKLASTEALLAAGYAVAGIDAYGDNWGNADSVAAQQALYGAVPDAYKTAGVYFWAQSMGGLAALESIDVLPNVKAWAGIFPVCNLRSVYDLGPLAGFIAQAHPNDLTAALATLSPVVPANLAGLPMIFWASPGDTVVPKSSNTDLCASQYAAAGADVTVVPTTGEHGDPSNFDAAALLAFFDAA